MVKLNIVVGDEANAQTIGLAKLALTGLPRVGLYGIGHLSQKSSSAYVNRLKQHACGAMRTYFFGCM